LAAKKKAAAANKKASAKRKPKTTARTPPVTEKKKMVLAVMNKINRSAKKQVIRFAEDAPNTFFLRRPTGIMQLDIDLAGGFPAGGFSTISGPDGTAKTTLLYMIFGMQQRLFGKECAIAFASPESAIDFFWARQVGWMIAVPDSIIAEKQELRRVRGLPLMTREEIAELKTEIGINVRVDADDGEGLLNNLEKMIRSGAFNVVALDSLESVIPNAEAKIDDYHTNPQQAARATILSRFMQHWGSMMSGVDGANWTTFLATGQVRANRGKSTAPAHIAKYLREWESTAPRAVRHWRQIDLVVMNGEKVKREVNKVKFNIGKMLKWETGKGKAGVHEGITGDVRFDYEGLVDQLSEILTAGLRYGVIEEEEGKMTLHKESGEDDEWNEIPGREAFIAKMAESLDNEMMVRREILAAAGKHCTYR
jgi:RecA/RadA recombinase